MRIQTHPQPWTHHHVHRLYHLSLSICFGFAALAMVGTMSTVWMSASANPISDSVSISAQVFGVSPGPIGGGSGSKPTPPALTPDPTITIVAEPQGEIPGRYIQVGGSNVSAYVFDNDRPIFSGTTSVANGLVFIYIDGYQQMYSTALADGNGYWYWRSPDPLPNGIFSITASVFDSYNLTRSASVKVYFVIEETLLTPTPSGVQPTGQPGQPGKPGQTVPTPSQPGQPGRPTVTPVPTIPDAPKPPVPTLSPGMRFGTFFEILKSYKTVEANSKVVSWVSLVSNSGQPVVDQEINYTVTSPTGQLILETKDVVSFSKQSQFQKTFIIAPKTPPGEYTVRVSSKYNGIESIVSDTFIITEATSAGTITQGPFILWSLLLLLLLLFLVLVYISYRYVRHHTEQLNQQPTLYHVSHN